MYKVLIVDDEKMIRLGMKKAIPWRSIGIGEVLTAKSGREALGLVREQKPEIMITDIKMDEMTGLDLIEQAKKLVPGIRVLVLTGYDDFEYARQCIKLKVHDFFLKPIDEKALQEAVRKQVAYLEENNISELVDSNETRALAVAEQMSIESFLRNLLYGRIAGQEEKIREFCNKYNYDMKQNIQAAIIVPTLYAGTGNDSENFTALTIKNICIGLIDAQNRGLTFMDDYGRIVIAFFLNTQKNSVLDWIRELNGILRDEYNKKPKVAIGNPVNGFCSLNISYNDAIQLLQYEKEDGEIIQSVCEQNRAKLFIDIFSEMKNEMCANVTDSERVISIFEHFCRATDSYNISDSYTRKCCFELVASVYYAYLNNSGADADSRISIFVNSMTNLQGEELFELTRMFFIKLLDNKEEQNSHEIVERAKFYIMEHMSDNLSVSDIASYLYVSPNYLSKLFKRTTGEGCNEYIIRKRIEKAKLLLQTTSIKTSKIAEMVGYKDTNYFSMAVKKNTGMSPKMYREACQKNANP